MAPVAHAVSSYISFSTRQLAAIAQTTPAELPEVAASLRTEVTEQTHEVNILRSSVAALATQLQRLRLTLLETLVRSLEQVIHGSVARHSKARAEHLALVAEGLCSKTKLLALTQTATMDPALKEALEAYGSALGETHASLVAEEAKLTEKVRAYEKGGKGMRDLAKQFQVVLAEIQEVKEEIARLEEP